MTKKIIPSIGTTLRYSSLSDNTKVSKPSFYYYVLPSTFKNMKHVLQPPAPAQCSKSSQIDHPENGKYLHDDTKGGALKIGMDHSQNIQSCTCTPQNVEYLRSLVFTPAYSPVSMSSSASPTSSASPSSSSLSTASSPWATMAGEGGVSSFFAQSQEGLASALCLKGKKKWS